MEQQVKDTDLETMLSSRTFEDAAGEKYPLRPFPFGSVVEVAKSAANLIDKVLAMPDNMMEDLKVMMDTKDIDPVVVAFFLDMLGGSVEDVYKLVAICADKPVQWVKDLDPVDGIIVTYLAFEVNKSFFTKSLPRLLKTMGIDKKLQAAIKKVEAKPDGAQ